MEATSKEQVIISCLKANYETGEKTDITLKDNLWVEFAKDEKVASTGQSLEREAFFSQLGPCVSKCSIKEVKAVRC